MFLGWQESFGIMASVVVGFLYILIETILLCFWLKDFLVSTTAQRDGSYKGKNMKIFYSSMYRMCRASFIIFIITNKRTIVS